MGVKAGYQRAEPEIHPDSWSRKQVRELGAVVTGGTPSTYISEYWNGDHPWITPTDISSRRDLYESERMISDAGLRAVRALPPNTVLVTCIASIGKNAILRTVGASNQQINAVIPNASNNVDFLFYLFESAKKYLAASAGTTATSIVSKAAFQSLEFLIPPLPEQRAIAEALSDVDALLSGLDRLIAKKRDLKQAAMQQLLTGQTRLPGFHGEWEVKRLGDVAEMGSGGTPPSSTSKFYGGDIPWVSIADMTKGGKLIFSTDRNLTAEGLSSSTAQMFPEGTVLYAMYASLGECSIAAIPLCTSQAILGIRPKSNLSGEFLYYFLVSLKGTVKSLGQQGTQANLNKRMVQDFRLSLPSLQEQVAIAQVLSDMDAELAALEARREKTRQLKQGMMQELLTGRTRLVQPEERVE